MKLLIIGGSYFLGRLFVQYAHEREELTVLNRGTHPLNMEGVTELKADRHDREAVRRVLEAPAQSEGIVFDAVIDFCAYQRGDVSLMCDVLRGRVRQYILISTVDVLCRGTGRVQDETAPYETRVLPGEAGDYISGKISLEKELMHCAETDGRDSFAWTVVRPSILYGPYNYAPREGYLVRRISEGKPVIFPEPSDSVFQFIYAPDAVKMIFALCGEERAENEIFHLCAEDRISYDYLREIIQNANLKGTRFEFAAPADGTVYFPFPVRREESELYAGQKITDITGIRYSPFSEKMADTLRLFARIYGVSAE